MLAEVKPCPFCGAEIGSTDYEDAWYFRGEGPPPSYAVRCDNCGAQGPFGNGRGRRDYAGAQERAVELWNQAPRAGKETAAGLVDPRGCCWSNGCRAPQMKGSLLCEEHYKALRAANE